MKTNKNRFRIIQMLFDRAGTWVCIKDIAHELDMTYHQASKYLALIPTPPLESELDGGVRFVRIVGTPQELGAMYEEYKSQYLGVKDEDKELIRRVLRQDPGACLDRITVATGLERHEAIRIISVMSDIDSWNMHGIKCYRLEEDVPGDRLDETEDISYQIEVEDEKDREAVQEMVRCTRVSWSCPPK
nr:MAG TPA: purine repressor [Caudoviricetes sp.]